MSTYAVESSLSAGPDGAHLDLATALGVTPAGRIENPVFFTGFVPRPDVVAAGLLAVADVAASRYADAGLAARLASLDPVVTAGGDRLRFESFSACNSVYARLDLDRGGLGTSEVGFGTTNVDISQPLRTALARVDRTEALHLSVGRDELRASSPAATHVERKVALPDRWVRGLAEVPALSASVRPVARLAGPAVGRFLGGLPRVAPPGPTLHLLPAGHILRAARVATASSVALPGASRLRGADRVARFATGLTLHAAPGGATAGVFDLPRGRFTLVLTPDPFRGFSGEGTLLTLLANPDAEKNGRILRDVLGWSGTVDTEQLRRDTRLTDAEVTAGLAWLAASGLLGYDIAAGAYFHRELPVDSDKVLRRNPRLLAAHALVIAGDVERRVDGWLVRGSSGTYALRGSEHLTCECAWEREHQGSRGPCKHILAALLAGR